jgi:hypothetical protein
VPDFTRSMSHAPRPSPLAPCRTCALHPPRAVRPAPCAMRHARWAMRHPPCGMSHAPGRVCQPRLPATIALPLLPQPDPPRSRITHSHSLPSTDTLPSIHHPRLRLRPPPPPRPPTRPRPNPKAAAAALPAPDLHTSPPPNLHSSAYLPPHCHPLAQSPHRLILPLRHTPLTPLSALDDTPFPPSSPHPIPLHPSPFTPHTSHLELHPHHLRPRTSTVNGQRSAVNSQLSTVSCQLSTVKTHNSALITSPLNSGGKSEAVAQRCEKAICRRCGLKMCGGSSRGGGNLPAPPKLCQLGTAEGAEGRFDCG